MEAKSVIIAIALSLLIGYTAGVVVTMTNSDPASFKIQGSNGLELTISREPSEGTCQVVGVACECGNENNIYLDISQVAGQ